MVIRDFVSQTTGIMHFYADADNGDDSNDGLSWSSAVKNLAALFNLIPDNVLHHVLCNMKGTFSNQDFVYLRKHLPIQDKYIILNGEGSEIVDGPWTADIHSTTDIGLTSLSLTPDEYKGRTIEILSGSQSGFKTFVQGHSATTFTPGANFPTDPGVCSFQLTKPSTVIQGTNSERTYLSIHCTGYGRVVLQNIRFDGNYVRFFPRNSVFLTGGVTFEGTGSSLINVYEGGYLYLAYFYPIDPVTLALDSIQRNGCFLDTVVTCNAPNKYVYVHSSVIKELNVYSPDAFWMAGGSRLTKLKVVGGSPGETSYIGNTSGYATTKITGSSGVGLQITNSFIQINDGVIIADNAIHGIEVNRSYIKMNGAVQGTGNAGAGVYAHSGSIVHTTDGTPPTITGTLGDCSLDGSSGVDLGSGVSDFWTDVEAGSKIDADIAANKEFCVVKKV